MRDYKETTNQELDTPKNGIFKEQHQKLLRMKNTAIEIPSQ